MKNRMKRTGAALTLIMLLMCMIPISVSAAAYIDTEREGALELHYQYEAQALDGVPVKIYRTAEVSSDGRYTLSGAFAQYPVRVNDITESSEWNEAAVTLATYAVADSIAPTASSVSGAEGKVSFSTLETGLYLVVSGSLETLECTYLFAPFLISIPNLDTGGSWIYEVLANPKAEAEYPHPVEVEHKVIKLWEDSGYEKNRPASITVDILKNGEKVFEKTLSAENNWVYCWTAPDDGSVWQAVERSVPADYTVSVRKDGPTITIKNTFAKEPPVVNPPKDPQTGDNSQIEVYFVLLIISGLALIVIGKTAKCKPYTV